MSQAFFAAQQCNQAGLPAPAANLTRNALGQPMCGSNNPTATCLQDMCCSLNGFCGPILNAQGVYEANGQVLTKEKAFDLYCNNAQGDWRGWTARGECKAIGLNYPRSATTTSGSGTSQEVPTVPPTPAAGDTKPDESQDGQAKSGPGAIVWIGAAGGAIVLGILAALFLVRRRRQQRNISGGGEVKVITSTPPPAQAAPRDSSYSMGGDGNNKDDPLCIPLSPGAATEFYNKRASSAMHSQQQQQQQQQQQHQAQRASMMQQQQVHQQRMSLAAGAASGRPISALAVDEISPDELVLADVADVNPQRFSNAGAGPSRPLSSQSGHSGNSSGGAFPVPLPPSNSGTPVNGDVNVPTSGPSGRPHNVTSMMSSTSSAPSSTQSYQNNSNSSAFRPSSHMSTTMAAPHLPPMPSVHANSTPPPSVSPTDLTPTTAAPGLPEYFSALRQFGSGNLGPRVAVHAFVPTRADELQVRAGDTVFVEHAFADGWARGRMHGHVGLFPLGVVAPAGLADYVVVALHNDMARMAAAQPDQVVPLTPGGHVWAGPTPRTASFRRLSRV